MSDTPRTDEQINGKPCTRFEILTGDSLRNASVPSEFARQLERELNALDASALRLGNASRQLLKMAHEQTERIKRLEEAGDALENDNYTSDNLEAWLKAKEDKP